MKKAYMFCTGLVIGILLIPVMPLIIAVEFIDERNWK